VGNPRTAPQTEQDCIVYTTVNELIAKETRRFNGLTGRLENFLFSPILFRIAFVLVIALYVASTVRQASRHLWHDELYTYYIAGMPSMPQFWDALKLDLNPPLSYLAVRGSMKLFGDSSYAVRLPSMIAFLVGALSLYRFISFRTSRAFGLLGMLVFLCSPYLSLATEARPYALVTAFLGLALVAWQRTLEHVNTRWAIALLFLCLCGMMLSHLFGVFYACPFLAAEFVTWARTRKRRLGVWAALLIPYAIPAVYLSKAKGYQASSIPQAFQASIHKILAFYAESIDKESSALLFACLAGMLIVLWFKRPARPVLPFSFPEKVFALTLLLLPVYENLVLMRSHSGFFSRYALPTIFTYSIFFVVAMVRSSLGNKTAALAASCVLLLSLFQTHLLDAVWGLKYGHNFFVIPLLTSDPCADMKPELPLVAASGLTFLEMDRYASAGTKSRLYYLTDRKLAVQYAGATIFEGLPDAKKKFPIRGNVEPYVQFVKDHPHFLVLGTPSYPEDWLIRQLLAIGSHLRFLGMVPNDYKDWHVFEVTMPDAAAKGI